MKNNSESKRFHTSGHSCKKNTSAANRKTRKPQLESLEARQLLSAVSMAGAESNIQSEIFYVTLNNANNMADTTTQYVAMHVQGNVDASDIKITDSNNVQQNVLKSTFDADSGITTLLLKMGFGTDYTVTVDGVNSQNPISVLFTTPGDTVNGDGMVNNSEYYNAYGNLLKGAGWTQRSAMLFQQQYGVNVSTLELNPLHDLDGNGVLSQSEFNTLIKTPFDNHLDVVQQIIVKPEISDLKVDGITPTVADEEAQKFVVATQGEDGVTITGKLPENGNMTILGSVSYKDADGNTQTVSLSDMRQNQTGTGFEYTVDADGNFSLKLDSVKSNTEIALTLSYDGADNSENTYTILLDTQAPALVLDSLTWLPMAVTYTDGKTYTKDSTPAFTVSAVMNTDTYNAILAEIADSAQGVQIVLTLDGTDLRSIALTAQSFKNACTKTGETYTFSYDLTLTNAAADGKHTLGAYTKDLAGNKTAEVKKDIIIDTVIPAVASTGYTVNHGASMYVDVKNQSLTVTISDTNLKDSSDTSSPVITLNGTAISYKTVTAGTGTLEYVIDFTLAYGENALVFTCTDIAGNESSKTFKYIYNEVPEITAAGQELDDSEFYVTNNVNEGLDFPLGKITDLFSEKDGSEILAKNVSLTFDGDAVTGWKIAEDGTIQATLRDCGTDLATFNSNVTITYTDEYGKVAFYNAGDDSKQESLKVFISVTNDESAPVVTFENAADFAGKITPDVLTVSGSAATLKFKADDFNEIDSAVVTIQYETADGAQTKTLTWDADSESEQSAELTGLKDGSSIQISYESEDNFGHKTESAVSLGTIAVDATLAGSITKFEAQAATPSKAQPKFDLTVTWVEGANEKMNAEIAYTGENAAGETVSGTFRGEFIVSDGTSASSGVFTNISGEALADGTYTFTVTLWDNAGNEKTASVQNYVVDTTAPTAAITNTSAYTNTSPITLNLSYSDNLSGVVKLTLTHNGIAKDITPAATYDVDLKYGENTFKLTATDAAGNVSDVSAPYTVVWNVKPVANAENACYNASASTPASAVFDELMSIGFKETSGPYAGKIVLDMKDYFIDEETLLLDGSLNLTNNTAIESAQFIDGKLVLEMKDVTLDETLAANLSFTLKDAYGEKIAAAFNFEYIYDDKAPSVKASDFGFNNNAAFNAGDYVLDGSNDLGISAKFTDDTAIKSWGWNVVNYATGTVIASGNGTIAEEAVKSHEVTISKAIGDLPDGIYTVNFWGDDGITNVSSATAPSVSYSFIVDTAAPVFNGSVTLKDSTALTNKTSETFTITGTVTDAGSCWLVIYDGSTVAATVKANADGTFAAETTVSNLADGEHVFTYQVFDAASHKAFTNARTIGTVVVDTAAPVISSITVTDGVKKIVEESGNTEKNVAKFTFNITDAHSKSVTKYYSTNDGSTWTEYPEAGVTLAFGDTVFRFKAVDAAGNETEWNGSITMTYDHSPILTESTLAGKSFDFPAEGVDTVTVQYTEAEIKALFNDSDTLDTLKYEFAFTASESLNGKFALTSQVLAEGTWTLTFTVSDRAALKAAHEAGTLTVTVTDSYEESETCAAAVISKTNLAPEQVKTDTLTQTQKTSGTAAYTFGVSDYFSDPESDTWNITGASVKTNGSANGSCAIDGKNVTWTPASGLYGNAVLSVTVTDGTDSKTYEVNVLINWAGITSLTAAEKTVAEDSGAGTIAVTVGNAFDASNAWGGYTQSTVWSVTNVNQTSVSGAVVSTSETGVRTRTDCTSLFTTAGVTIDQNGVISFTTAENAYGSAVVTFQANDVSQTVKINVTNVACTPYAPAAEVWYQVSSPSAEYSYEDLLEICDTDEDSGTLEFADLKLTASENVTMSGNILSIVKGTRTYTFQLTTGLTSAVVTRGGIFENDSAITAQESDWEALDGTEVMFKYTVKNASTLKTAEADLKLNFSAIARTVTVTAERKTTPQTITVNASDLIGEEGWHVSAVNASGTKLTAVLKADGNIDITIPAYDYADEAVSFTLAKDGETKTYSAKINVNITDVNWPPTWVDGYAASSKTHAWGENEQDSEYTLDFTTLVRDYDTNASDMKYALKDGSVTVTDSRTGFESTGTVTVSENGTVTFEPDDENFYGTVEFTVSVTDEAVGTAAALTSDFKVKLTITDVNDAPVPKTDANFTISCKVGETLNLNTLLKDNFYDPDGTDDTITVTYNNAATYTAPAQMGVYVISVTASDSNGASVTQNVTLQVSASAKITDASLDTIIYNSKDYTAAGKLTENITVPAYTTTAAATFTAGTVLKAGTVLSAGTVFSKNMFFKCDSEPAWIEGWASWDSENKEVFVPGYTLTNSITLTEDISIAMKTITAAAESVIAEGSTIAVGSNLGKDITISIPSYSAKNVRAIFQAATTCREAGDGVMYMKQELKGIAVDAAQAASLERTSGYIAIFDAASATGYSKATISYVGKCDAADSPFGYITYEGGKFYAYYSAFDVTQNRSEQALTLEFNDGNHFDVNLSIDYETPFDIVFGVVEKNTDVPGENYQINTSRFITDFSTLQSGKEYCLQVALRSNLPLTAEEMKYAYDKCVQMIAPSLTVKLTGLTKTQLSKGSADFENDPVITENGDGSISVTLGRNFMEMGLNTFSGSYACSCLFFTTGTDAVTVTNPNIGEVKYSFVMNYSGDSAGADKKAGDYGVGIVSEIINASQYKVGNYLTAAPVHGTTAAKETVVEGNGVYAVLVKEKSESEISSSLRKNEDYITEWDSSDLELWVNTQEAGTDISNVYVDLSYNSKYFTAVNFEYSSFVKNGLSFEIDDASGKVTGIGGDLSNAVTNKDGFILLGRLHFESQAGDNVAADTVNFVSMGISLDDVILRNSEGTRLEVNQQVIVDTKVFAVVYDANDDGEINVTDLIAFAKKYGTDTTSTTDAASWALDFNNSGNIDVNDLIAFAKNYGKSQGNANIQYPANFFKTWIGSTLEADGDSNVADTLENALDSWSEALGEELNMNVQIIVKDFENVDGGILGETVLLGCGEDGKPDTAVVYLDEDALGMGWYVGTSDDVIDDQYDLYTVLLHELGHALGMSSSYEGYNTLIDAGLTFTDENGNSHFVFNGHVYADGDLMNEILDTGTRLEVSSVDAQIVSQARKNGGNIISGTPDAAIGAHAARTEVEVASSIVAEETWNAMLVEKATQAVAQAQTELNASALQLVEEERGGKELQKFESPSENGVNLNVAGTENVGGNVLDELFGSSDFTDSLEEDPADALDVTLGEDK